MPRKPRRGDWVQIHGRMTGAQQATRRAFEDFYRELAPDPLAPPKPKNREPTNIEGHTVTQIPPAKPCE